jgi:plastocyanin
MKTNLSWLARHTRLWWWILSLATVVLLAGCGGSTAANPTPTATTPPAPTATTQPSPTAPATVVTVKIVEKNEKYSFQPATLSIKVGTEVMWVNTSDAPHTVTSDTAGDFGTTSAITQNQNFTFTFTSPGTFPYHCNIHPYMKATITVSS